MEDNQDIREMINQVPRLSATEAMWQTMLEKKRSREVSIAHQRKVWKRWSLAASFLIAIGATMFSRSLSPSDASQNVEASYAALLDSETVLWYASLSEGDYSITQDIPSDPLQWIATNNQQGVNP